MAYEREFWNGITHRGRKLRADATEIFMAPGDLSKFGTTLTMSNSTPDTASLDWDRTLVTQDVPNGASSLLGVGKLRVTTPTGTAGASTRLNIPIIGSECINGEIGMLLLDRTQGSQIGLFGRGQPNPAESNRPWAYNFWHDVVFNVESHINAGTFQRLADGTLEQGTSNTGGDLEGLRRYVPVLHGTKSGTAVKLYLEPKHGMVVGDSFVVATPEIDEYICVVTEVTDTSISYTSGISGTVVNSGPGFLMSRSVMPYFLNIKMEGTTAFIRGWHLNAGKPSWSDPNHAFRWTNLDTGPTTEGLWGLYVGHLADDTAWVDVGYMWWRSRD